jgi:thiol-disulfide isomerase/thioredoxin
VIERVVLIALVGAGIVFGIALARALARHRLRRLAAQPGGALLERLGTSVDGRATLVAFSTPSCAACHTAQAPAVARVEQEVGASRLRVVHVDAAHQPDVASAFGIMTVPSTVLLDPAGRVTAVNHGFASSRQLARQLQTV